MKNLKELYSYVTKLPCVFATSSDTVSTFPAEKGSDTNYDTGITEKYARATTSSGEQIKRADMNRIGAIATMELFYKMIGMQHSFSSEVEKYYGYVDKAVLDYYDGYWNRKVESQIEDNKTDFLTESYAVDCIPNGKNQIEWKTVSFINGMDDGALRMVVDFSNRNDLSDGDSLDEDSLVVIGQATHNNVTDASKMDGINCTISIADENGNNYSLNLANKGKCGMKYSVWGILFWSYSYPDPLAGSSNYTMALFAKKGSKFSVAMTANGQDVSQGRTMFAYPVRMVVDNT